MAEPNWDESLRIAGGAMDQLHLLAFSGLPQNLRDVAWVIEGSVRTLKAMIEQERTRSRVSDASRGRR